MLVMMMQPNQNRKPPEILQKMSPPKTSKLTKNFQTIRSSLIREPTKIELLRVMTMMMMIQPNQDHKPQNTNERRKFQFEVDVAESSNYMSKEIQAESFPSRPKTSLQNSKIPKFQKKTYNKTM